MGKEKENECVWQVVVGRAAISYRGPGDYLNEMVTLGRNSKFLSFHESIKLSKRKCSRQGGEQEHRPWECRLCVSEEQQGGQPGCN